jgi:peptidoglycan LD-endopeptidase CwlK
MKNFLETPVHEVPSRRDSSMSIEQALQQNPDMVAPLEIIEKLRVVSVQYYSFDGLLHEGQIVVDGRLQEDIRQIFELLQTERFPVEAVIPASDPRYLWNDDSLMNVNVSSSFNYRVIAGTSKLSLHAHGQAFDINPFLNPYIGTTGIVQPTGATYDISRPGTIRTDSPLVELCTRLGWVWGGHWTDRKDYQHFEKRLD